MSADAPGDAPLPRTPLGLAAVPVGSRVLFPGAADPVPARVRLVAVARRAALPAALLYPCRSFHLLEPDEGRYAQIPKEMLDRGEWVVPTLQGEPYLDKPPLMYWLVALSYAAFGVSRGGGPAGAGGLRPPDDPGRVPDRPAEHRRAGRVLGGAAADRRPGFVGVARLLLLDGLLTLCVTLSVLCGFEAVRTGRLKLGWWVASAVASGLGFLTKGPISEVLLFVPLLAFGLAERAPPPASAGRRLALFLASWSAVNLPWYVAIYLRQPEFLGYFFWEHNVMRFLQPFDHLQPVWYYVPILLGGLLPGTVLVGAVPARVCCRGGPDVGATGRRPAGSGCSPAAVVRVLLQLLREQAADVHPAGVPVPVPGARASSSPAAGGTRAVATRGLVVGVRRADRARPLRRAAVVREGAVADRPAGAGGAVRGRPGHGRGDLPAELRLGGVLHRPQRPAARADEGREPDDRGLPPPPADGGAVHAPPLVRGVPGSAAAEPAGGRGGRACKRTDSGCRCWTSCSANARGGCATSRCWSRARPSTARGARASESLPAPQPLLRVIGRVHGVVAAARCTRSSRS